MRCSVPVPQLTHVRAVITTCMPSCLRFTYTAIATQGRSCGLSATQWAVAAFHKNSLCIGSALDPSSAIKGAEDARL